MTGNIEAGGGRSKPHNALVGVGFYPKLWGAFTVSHVCECGCEQQRADRSALPFEKTPPLGDGLEMDQSGCQQARQEASVVTQTGKGSHGESVHEYF